MIYNFISDEKLLNPNQSGFRQSDPCANQLLAKLLAHVKYSKRLVVTHHLKLDQSS